MTKIPQNKNYKLSPSDFAYLYEECKCCYYLKVKQGIERPQTSFPGVFSALNTRLQSTLVGHELSSLAPTLPQGTVESQEGSVQSLPVEGANVYIKGKYDLLVKQPDDSYLIVDFKISNPAEEKITKYQTQLQAYHYALTHPAFGEPKNITRLGLVVMYPDKVKFVNGKAVLTFPPKWLEVQNDQLAFVNFIKGIQTLLDGPVPPENPTCRWCGYRHLGEKLAGLGDWKTS